MSITTPPLRGRSRRKATHGHTRHVGVASHVSLSKSAAIVWLAESQSSRQSYDHDRAENARRRHQPDIPTPIIIRSSERIIRNWGGCVLSLHHQTEEPMTYRGRQMNRPRGSFRLSRRKLKGICSSYVTLHQHAAIRKPGRYGAENDAVFRNFCSSPSSACASCRSGFVSGMSVYKRNEMQLMTARTTARKRMCARRTAQVGPPNHASCRPREESLPFLSLLCGICPHHGAVRRTPHLERRPSASETHVTDSPI